MTSEKEKTKILVIDDERLIRLTLNAKLKQIGYTAVCVASIPEAVVMLNDGGYMEFKAIITDIMMGQVDGFKFRDMIRTMNTDIPIIFLSSLMDDSSSSLLLHVMEDSYSYFLRKGASKVQLQAKIEQALSISRPQAELKSLRQRFDRNLALASHHRNSILTELC